MSHQNKGNKMTNNEIKINWDELTTCIANGLKQIHIETGVINS